MVLLLLACVAIVPPVEHPAPVPVPANHTIPCGEEEWGKTGAAHREPSFRADGELDVWVGCDKPTQLWVPSDGREQAVVTLRERDGELRGVASSKLDWRPYVFTCRDRSTFIMAHWLLVDCEPADAIHVYATWSALAEP